MATQLLPHGEDLKFFVAGLVHTVFRIKLPVKQVDRYGKIL